VCVRAVLLYIVYRHPNSVVGTVHTCTTAGDKYL